MHKIKSIPRYGAIFCELFLLTFSIGFVLLSVLLLYHFLVLFELGVLGGLLIISFLSVVLIQLTMISFIKVHINRDAETLEIVYFLFLKKRVKIKDVYGYIDHKFTNRMGVYDGMIIQLASGKQYQVSEFCINNYSEIKEAISNLIERKKTIQENLHPYMFHIMIIYWVLAVVLMVLIAVFNGAFSEYT